MNLNSPEVLRAAAESMVPAIREWLDQDGPNPDTTDEMIIEDVMKAIDGEDDGYRIAKRMDSWEPDAWLVEIMDGAFFAKDKALKKLAQ